MPQYSAIVRTLSVEKFGEILLASSRQSRELYFHRLGIKAPKARGLPKAGGKSEQRSKALHAILQTVEDEEVAEELLRTWLLTKRSMLAAALDHLKIAHHEGLTESDEVAKMRELTGAARDALFAHVCQAAPGDEARIYLQFMGVPDAAAL